MDIESMYNEQVDYIKGNYPNKSIYIKEHGRVKIDDVSNYDDLFYLVKNKKIRCEYCAKEIKKGWLAVYLIPKEDKPISLLFFCHKPKCAVLWQEKREQELKCK